MSTMRRFWIGTIKAVGMRLCKGYETSNTEQETFTHLDESLAAVGRNQVRGEGARAGVEAAWSGRCAFVGISKGRLGGWLEIAHRI